MLIAMLRMAMLAAVVGWTIARASGAPLPYAAADLHYRARADATQARAAYRLYADAVARSQRAEPDALWRLAMASYFVGLRLTEEPSAKQALFAEGRRAGEDCARLAPENAACHFWGAINTALYGESLGAFKTLSLIPEIKRGLERSSALDPALAGGGAYRVLGAIYQRLPGLLGGSDEQARRSFERAIAVAPDEPLNYLFLSRLLLESAPDGGQAREVARRGLAVPEPGTNGRMPENLESIEARQELRKLLAER
jgi:hypothetical protein